MEHFLRTTYLQSAYYKYYCAIPATKISPNKWKKVPPPKFPMPLNARNIVGKRCLKLAYEITQMDVSPLIPDSGSPFIPYPMNALELRCRKFRDALLLIARVLHRRNDSEIVALVIERVAVHVVNNVTGLSIKDQAMEIDRL